MKILKQKILFILACTKDFFYHQRFGYFPYCYLYDRLPVFQRSSVRDACLQLVETGELDRIVKNRQTFFRLTAQGRSQLMGFFPQLRATSKKWDVVWRIVTITPSLPKKNGAKAQRLQMIGLRSKIKELGMQKLVRGTYISPLAIGDQLKEYIVSHKLGRQVVVWETSKLLVGDSAVFGRNLWGLEKLERQYQLFIRQSRDFNEKIKQQKEISDFTYSQYYRLLTDFFELLKEDPGLPGKAIGFKWPLNTARESFLVLSRELIRLEKNRF